MATEEDLALLRLYIHDPSGNKEVFSDQKLQLVLDEAGGNVALAASKAWTLKAGTVAEWYDVSLDGSSLSREQVFRHCIRMAATYADQAGSGIVSVKIDTTPELTEDAEFAQ